MKEKVKLLLDKYKIQYLETQTIISTHNSKGCFCDECYEAMSNIDIISDCYNDLLYLYQQLD